MAEVQDIRLANDELEAIVSNKGVELQSVVCDGIERIWCGDPEVWGRKAPLLFPLIGRLRDGWYALDGERVNAPMHGFCRDRVFDVVEATPTRVVFQTESDDETRKVFPFDFRLQVIYSLEGSTITKTHVVENLDDAPMLFEVGGHEAYATRLLSGESMSDYYVQFEGAGRVEMFGMDDDGILYLPKIEVPLNDGRLTKTPEQLGIDTIILEDVLGSVVTLASTTNPYKTRVEFADFPYLGIWTMAGQEDARYLCIEPWSTLPDGSFMSRELSERPGICTVYPGEKRTLSYTMSFE